MDFGQLINNKTGIISLEMNALLEGIVILCTLPATAASAVVQ